MARLIRCFIGGAGTRCAFLGVFFFWVIAQMASAAAEAKKPPGDDIFNGTNIVRVDIKIPKAGIDRLSRYWWGGGRSQQDRPEVKATITEGGRSYTNVAIHLKGSAGSFSSINDQPALTLNFDKFVPDQTFHGLKKISLNNSRQDQSRIQEKLCREMFEAAGVPVPRADYAVVTLNGRPLGLYVLVEGYNKQFLKRYFKDTSGNLYDGGFCQEVNEYLNVNSGDHPEDRSGMRRFLNVINSANGKENGLKEIEQVLDVDRFLAFVAMEDLTVHWDGYTMNRNNYRVYHDKDSGKMIFMPHGMDQMFGAGGRGSPDLGIVPYLNGYVAGVVLGFPEGRSRYIKKLIELRTNIFNLEAVTNRVRQINAKIQPALQGRSDRWAVNHLVECIVQRNESLNQQLAPRQTIAFDINGIAKLEGWRPRGTGVEGKFDASTTETGRKTLHIRAEKGGSAYSWRTRVPLLAGRYRFEGFAKTLNAPEEADQGVQLRISQAPGRVPLHGNTDWIKLSYGFEVPEPGMDVELICELKGSQGEAWFDSGTLRLRRLE
jgi:spore coat protein H